MPLDNKDCTRKFASKFGDAVMLNEQLWDMQQGVSSDLRLDSYIGVSKENGTSIFGNHLELNDAVTERNFSVEEMLGGIVHERGHVFNRDWDSARTHVDAAEHLSNLFPCYTIFHAQDSIGVGFQYDLEMASFLIERYQENPEHTIDRLYQSYGSIEAVLSAINAISKEYRAVSRRYKNVASYLEAYPGFEELTPFDLMTDRAKETTREIKDRGRFSSKIIPKHDRTFTEYVAQMPSRWGITPRKLKCSIDTERRMVECYKTQQEAVTLRKAYEDKLAGIPPTLPEDVWVVKDMGQETNVASCPTEGHAIIAARMDKLIHEHQKFHDNNITIRYACNHILQACEYLADFHAVEHGYTEESISVFRKDIQDMEEKNIEDADATHPNSRKRIEAIGDFTEAIRQEREQGGEADRQSADSNLARH